jgi:hypothetical protein
MPHDARHIDAADETGRAGAARIAAERRAKAASGTRYRWNTEVAVVAAYQVRCKSDTGPVDDGARAGAARHTHNADRNTAAAWRYLRATALGAVLSFLLLWAWIAAAPLAYLDPEYPYWRAKQELLRDCDLGEVLILGDSRAAAGVLPAMLPFKATNLAVGGGKPVEAYAALIRALDCPVLPRRVILSFDTAHFMLPDLFWERAVQFGFVGHDDLAALRITAARFGDDSLYLKQRFAALPSFMRDWLYEARFPPLYFASLAQGGGFLRWPANRRALAAGLAARGQYFFGTDPGSSVVAVDAHLPRFVPTPVLNWYFDRILAALAERGIPVDFLALPMNQATAREVRPAMRAAFETYLAGYATRYPGFHVLGDLAQGWPDRLFGDMFAHLNPEGAALFTVAFGRCLQARLAVGEAASCHGDWPAPTGVVDVSQTAQ